MIWLLAIILFGFCAWNLYEGMLCSGEADACRREARFYVIRQQFDHSTALRVRSFGLDQQARRCSQWAIMFSVAAVVALIAAVFA